MTVRCNNCGAEIIFGEPHKMWSSVNGVAREVTQCEECADYYAWACWNEEWGPYPSHLTHHKAGKA
jgi:hypothetical protein